MNVNIIKNEGLERHFKVVVPVKNIQEKVDSYIKDVAKTYKMPGFRPGKVPVDFIVKKHGRAVWQDVVENQINTGLKQIIKDHKLDLATEPKFEDLVHEEGKDVEFTLKCEVLPEITIPDLKKIKLEKPVVNVTKSEIDNELKEYVSNFTEFKKASNKTKAKIGDQLLISFEGFIDGVAFEGGKAEDYKLVLGKGEFIKGFEDQLVGSKEGDEKTVKVTFPKDYSVNNLAGKDAEFVVIVKEVSQPIIPELNEEFLKKLNIESVEKLREILTDRLKSDYQEKIHTFMKLKLFDQLEDKLDFLAPNSLVDREFNILWDQLQQIKEVDDTVKSKDEKKLESYYKKVSIRRVKIGLMLSKYAEIKDIKIHSEDISKALYAQARMFPGDPKVLYEYYQKNPKALESLKGPILEDKAVNMIFEQELELETKEYSISDLTKLLDDESNKEVV